MSAPDPSTDPTCANAPTRLAREAALCLRFYSRLPLPPLPFESDPFAPPDFSRAAQFLPLVGVIVAAPGALALALAAAAGAPALASAALCLLANALASGCFHEDGLADVADGFGGGPSAARKLDIMKDSRVGTYGASALALSYLARAGALAGLLETGGIGAGVAAWLACAALARLFGLIPLALLRPARADGAGFAAARPLPGPLMRGGALGILAAGALVWLGGLSPWGLAAGLAGAGLAVGALARAARRQIGGQTGDVAGAAEQLAEMALLIALSARGF